MSGFLALTTALLLNPGTTISASAPAGTGVGALEEAAGAVACFGTPDDMTPQPNYGKLCGQAKNARGQSLPKHTARVRSIDGKLVSELQTAADGSFLTQAPAGQYVVEIVDAAGNIVGTATATVNAGVTTTLTVTASAATIAAAGGASGLAALISGTSGIVLGTVVAATAITIIAVEQSQDEDSPSR